MSYLSWTDLSVGYVDAPALIHPFSGSFDAPGIYALLGQNGCGKSTLLKTWLGLLRPLAGTITFAADKATYVPQFHTVNHFFPITVLNFIRQGFGPTSPLSRGAEDQLIRSLLTEWQLEGYAHKSFHSLSGGQRTRCMVIRALISQPKIIFLDEPLASLDSCCARQLMDTLIDFTKTKRLCVVMTDHHLTQYKNALAGTLIFERHHDAPTSHICVGF